MKPSPHRRSPSPRTLAWLLVLVAALFAMPAQALPAPLAPKSQSPAEAEAKSAGCIGCHTASDARSMHQQESVLLGCSDCHGGDPTVRIAPGAARSSPEYAAALAQAHVQPRFPDAWQWPSSANPEQSYTLLNREDPEYLRFVNPGDYRVADEACGACHQEVIDKARRSLMATTAMFWEGAAYNNGILPYKRGILGEAYTRDGEAAAVLGPVKPDANMQAHGVLAQLYPLPTWETTPQADIFRIFERGGRNIGTVFPETGLPNLPPSLERLDEPGRPDQRQSNRGPGTGNRIAVPVLNLHKTRLNDPLMWFLGSNDQPGDYRSSGCSACHVVYANDRDPFHSGPYAKFGNGGVAQTVDPTIPADAPGHPLQHRFTSAIPTSQCMVCHMHQPNIFVNSFMGYTMWDYESDAPLMWPEHEKHPSDAEIRRINERNPEEAAIRGKWSDPEFLRNVSSLNPQLKDTQFADYHGHGWNFRAIFKRDRQGHLLDKDGGIVSDQDPDKFHKSVQLASIHMEKGMQCGDCHFAQDAHGDGHIYGEVAQAVEIDCVDCHGTVDRYPSLLTSGPAAPAGGHDLSVKRTPFGKLEFEWIDGRLIQRSNVDPDLEWQVHLVKDSVTPGHPLYNAKAARAKLMAADPASQHWGLDVAPEQRAHQDDNLMCISCHTSWTTSCGGCHLPIQANWQSPRHHYEGGETRNFATYNPQVVRDEIFQLGIHGPAKGGRIAPVRSSSALVLSSTNANREKIYIQQPPISAAGFSSQAFAPHYPHTERTTETKQCGDCHLSRQNDNNAIMAQLLTLGTNFINFIGYNAWLGEDGALSGVTVTEWDEPQAVIGSYLHRYAYPERYQAHLARGRTLPDEQSHRTGGRVGCLQLRGEFLYVAQGKAGFEAYDASSIANKGFSERVISAPFSPLGDRIHVATEDASCVALPSNQPIDPVRNDTPLMRVTNQEQAFHPIYHYALISDRVEGLILVKVDTLADGEPRNNFLGRALTWNGDAAHPNILAGARHLTIAGDWVYVAADVGVVVLNLAEPLKPVVAAVIPLQDARATAVQFRYLFVTTGYGLEVVDITHPDMPQPVEGARVRFSDARRVYLVRTYAYVAAGAEGLGIVDITNPEAPQLLSKFSADGALNDVWDVKVGATNASLFAYLANGQDGLAVLQLISPETQPGFYGFSPEPKPQLIATRRTGRAAYALSEGLHRDRAVDETGGQIAVFGRIGSRPFNLAEQQKFYLDRSGKPWYVDDQERPRNSAAR